MKNIVKILKEIKETSPFPWWELDLERGSFKFNSGKNLLFHFDLEKFLNLYYYNISKNFPAKLKKIANSKNYIYKNFFKIKDKSGNYKWYLDFGAVLKNGKDGKPRIVRGFIIDLEKFFQNEFIEENEIIFVCSNCGKFKILNSKWIDVPKEVDEIIKNKISHSLCPKCLKLYYN